MGTEPYDMPESASRSVTPFVRALLDPLREGVIVFAPDGKLVYANAAADTALRSFKNNGDVTRAVLPRLSRLGARISPLWVNGAKIGEAVYLPPRLQVQDNSSTLANRERQAILEMLESTGWKLTESASRLGISRTTLWRRLRAYGLERDNRGRWSQPS